MPGQGTRGYDDSPLPARFPLALSLVGVAFVSWAWAAGAGRLVPTPIGVSPEYRLPASPVIFRVRQTYSSGKVVDWTGPESSDTPAPRVQALSSFSGGGTSILSIIALVLGAAALLLAGVGLFGGKRPIA